MSGRHVALLRAVNVGGRGKIAMVDLRAVAEAAGWRDVATVLQSGSLIFSAKGSGPVLERVLETALKDKLSLATQIIIRSAEQWRILVDNNPFSDKADKDPSHLLVLTGKSPIPAAAEAAVKAAIKGRETVTISEGTAYTYYPDGIGRSKLTTAVLERHFLTPVTGRNWNTVLKIADLLRA